MERFGYERLLYFKHISVRAGFRFYCHDFEHTLLSVQKAQDNNVLYDNRVGFLGASLSSFGALSCGGYKYYEYVPQLHIRTSGEKEHQFKAHTGGIRHHCGDIGFLHMEEHVGYTSPCGIGHGDHCKLADADEKTQAFIHSEIFPVGGV